LIPDFMMCPFHSSSRQRPRRVRFGDIHLACAPGFLVGRVGDDDDMGARSFRLKELRGGSASGWDSNASHGFARTRSKRAFLQMVSKTLEPFLGG